MAISYYYFLKNKGTNQTHWLIRENFHIFINIYKLPYSNIICNRLPYFKKPATTTKMEVHHLSYKLTWTPRGIV